jgi:hypothetical protein
MSEMLKGLFDSKRSWVITAAIGVAVYVITQMGGDGVSLAQIAVTAAAYVWGETKRPSDDWKSKRLASYVVGIVVPLVVAQFGWSEEMAMNVAWAVIGGVVLLTKADTDRKMIPKVE